MDGMTWRKSSRCDSNLCIEVGADWTRSSRCANGECLEARRPTEVEVHVRDSTDPDGPILTFTSADWRTFLAGLR